MSGMYSGQIDSGFLVFTLRITRRWSRKYPFLHFLQAVTIYDLRLQDQFGNAV